MKRFFSNLLIIIYAVIAIFVTVCLLSFNDYRVTEFGNYSLIIIDNSEIQGDFQKGSLAIVCKDPLPKVGEKAFFYNVLSRNEIVLADVEDINDYPNTEDTFSFGNEALVSESSIIGSTANAKVIPYAGTVLKILESKWGYLFLVVLISLLMFLYELTKAIEDIKENKIEERKDIKARYDAENEKKEVAKEVPEITPVPDVVKEDSVGEVKESSEEASNEETIDEPKEETKLEAKEESSASETEEKPEKVSEVKAEEKAEETSEVKTEENKEEKKSENVEINDEIREDEAENKDIFQKIDEIEDSIEENTEDIEDNKKEENK